MKQSLLFIFILLTLHACVNREKEKDVEIGKYVYMDNDSTIHINTKCLKFIIDEKKDFGVKRILADGISPSYLDKTCNYCVNDQAYEKLESMKGEEDRSHYDISDDSLKIGW